MTRARSRDYVATAARYAEDMVSGKIPACQWTIKACKRQLGDLERAESKEFPYRFDREKASRICRFIEMLPHIKGEWAKHGSRIGLHMIHHATSTVRSRAEDPEHWAILCIPLRTKRVVRP